MNSNATFYLYLSIPYNQHLRTATPPRPLPTKHRVPLQTTDCNVTVLFTDDR